MIGERPEAYIPLKGGKVPVEIGENNNPVIVHQQFNIYTPDANSFRASEKQIMTQAMMRASRAAGRNV